MLVNINTAYKEETGTEEMLISVIDLLHKAVTLTISIPLCSYILLAHSPYGDGTV